MGITSTVLGQPLEFEYNGQPYKMAPLNYEVQGLYERYMEKEATLAAERQASWLPKDKGDRLLTQVNRDIAAGLYTFGGEEIARSLVCTKHFTQLLYLLIQYEMPQVSYNTVKQMVTENMDLMIQHFNVANADPTKPATT